MRVLVAMSGGVDSSLAAARLIAEGHEVVGATLKLWGGEGDSGCCSLADVTDARRVADGLGIDHHVFNYEGIFDKAVVQPYVEAHRRGATPNPCVECNREVKFGALLERSRRLGFDALATGHHARVERSLDGPVLRRGADPKKDQSYVLSVLTADQLADLVLPIGTMTKDEVRREARRLGLRTADKADSQDVCFVSARAGGREAFLGTRIELHRAEVVDVDGTGLGSVEAYELLTIGQRRGVGLAQGERRYVTSIDTEGRRVTLGRAEDLLCIALVLGERTWTGQPLPIGAEVGVQVSAHGGARPARLSTDGVTFALPERSVAPGQIVACYVGDAVVGSGVVVSSIPVER